MSRTSAGETLDPLVRRSLGFFRRGPAWSLAIALAVAAFALARATAPLVTDASADRSFAPRPQTASTSAGAGQGWTRGLHHRTCRPACGAGRVGPARRSPGLRPAAGLGVAVAALQRPRPSHARDSNARRERGTRRSCSRSVIRTRRCSRLRRQHRRPPPGSGYPTPLPRPWASASATTCYWASTIPTSRDRSGWSTPRRPIAGVYATDDGLPVSRHVRLAVDTWTPAERSVGSRGTASLLLADTGTAMSLIAAMDDTPFVKWDLAWAGPVSIEQGRDAPSRAEADRRTSC